MSSGSCQGTTGSSLSFRGLTSLSLASHVRLGEEAILALFGSKSAQWPPSP